MYCYIFRKNVKLIGEEHKILSGISINISPDELVKRLLSSGVELCKIKGLIR